MELFQLKDVYFRYPNAGEDVLQGIHLRITSGEFIVLCGNSGCGKTTLLRHLKSAMMPHGLARGEILFQGEPLNQIDLRRQTAQIGYVSQHPDDQIVTDKVWHELAFGLESLGIETSIIRKRVAEMSHFFGIQEWFHQDVSALSGGQKQLLNLASVMVMQPEILLLDEPTAQLDPVAASEFLSILGRIHRELGTTVLLTEHRLEEVLPYCSRMLVMEKGRLILDDAPLQVADALRKQEMELFEAMPAPMRIWNRLETGSSKCPFSVQEGRAWFQQYADLHKDRITVQPTGSPNEKRQKTDSVLALEEVWFRYEKNGEDVLKGVSLQAYRGEMLAVLGGNGSGKTTMLSMIHGGHRPQRGKVCLPGGPDIRITSLPQNPQLLFLEDTVKKELEDMTDQGLFPGKENAGRQERMMQMIELCRLDGLLNRHPYDLSGGEQQRLALAKTLLTEPEILLLDEPTKGLDIGYKKVFGGILRELMKQGVMILMVSHDVEFCAEYATRCMLFFDGQIVAEDEPKAFFSENHFYTTYTNRMVRQVLPFAVTVDDVLTACKPSVVGQQDAQGTGGDPIQIPASPQITSDVGQTTATYDLILERGTDQKRLSAHTWVEILILLLAVPATILFGVYFLKDEKYVFIALLVLLECMLPFFLAFENRKPPTRDLVILSVLCAIGVAGRAIFVILPEFKPMTAIAIIAGVAFGGETGFLVGALTVLLSNMIFGQGPWTPWQMFALGLVGFFSGVLFSRSYRNRIRNANSRRTEMIFLLILCLYGFLSTVIVFGGIMNPATVIMAGLPLQWDAILSVYVSGLPFDLIHGASTVLFLFLGARPLLKKLERVKTKFG